MEPTHITFCEKGRFVERAEPRAQGRESGTTESDSQPWSPNQGTCNWIAVCLTGLQNCHGPLTPRFLFPPFLHRNVWSSDPVSHFVCWGGRGQRSCSLSFPGHQELILRTCTLGASSLLTRLGWQDSGLEAGPVMVWNSWGPLGSRWVHSAYGNIINNLWPEGGL